MELAMMGFGAVAALAEEMAGTGSRLKKRAAIAAAVQQAWSAGEVKLFCLYLAGLPFAEADGRKLNAGGALLTKAVLAVSGASQAELTAAYRRHGDLGAAAFDLLRVRASCRPTHRDETAMNGAREGSAGFDEKLEDCGGVTLGEVEEAFAGMAGARTTAARAGLVEGLLRGATALEAKYLLKLILGDMRIGVKQSLVEEAIAVAATEAGQAAEVAAVRHAVMLEADLGGAAERAFAGTLGEARMRLFHPLGFMLASPVETPEEAVARFTEKPKVVKKAKRKKAVEADELLVEEVGEDEKAPHPFVDKTDERMGHPDGVGSPDLVRHVEGRRVEAFLEDKFDGMRAQVHCGAAGAGGRVAIYSRNREEITGSFPELEEAFARVGEWGVGMESGLILDGEILGWDYLGKTGEAGQALPFAVLGQRIGRKRVDDAMRRSIPVVFMAFDLMFAEGELLLGLPLRERRNRLEEVAEALVDTVRSPLVVEKVQGSLFDGGEGAFPTHRDEAAMNGAPGPVGMAPEWLARLMVSPARLVETAEEIDRAYADARARANEGVMLKAAGSAYQPGRRGLAWVKLKRELATLDVVITGAEYGSGRRSQVLSDYTFAVRDEQGELKNVGKAYSGVTDAEIAELTEFLKAHTLEDYGHFRTVEPLVVLEVAFNNVMRSDRHASGFALRFPRILRIREDKPLEEIDTVARVEEVYQSQVDKPAEVAGGDEE